ncbi:hypothetical protein DF157_05275 [Burkholderia cenocepacia]|nr:hypothetical protein DF157_05275 [Burkholderia cenocepacia]RQV25876.1 hypothetical protein DF030_10205 [Burkholderia cenocepacia]RQV36381.1 hypothetical protein DF028_23745 [Burkholderia cenocepacia]RQV48571.1 hypothetical protein DF027_09285 [Burkholderia cenocepacia]RQV80785.1 hypothetical protein DF010_09810 [Burkholderia cenocepacia]
MRIALGHGAPAGIVGRIGGFHLNLALSSVDGAYSSHRHMPSRPESCSVIRAGERGRIIKDQIRRNVAAAAPAPFSSSSRHRFAAVRMRQIAVLTFFCNRNIASHHRRVYSWNCLLHVSS